MVFVGDSLNRNMWESLVCILRHSVEDKNTVYEISGRKNFHRRGYYAFRFEASTQFQFLKVRPLESKVRYSFMKCLIILQDYNCTVGFVKSPFLVKESSFNGKNGSFVTLRLDLMESTTSFYHDANILIFNTGHWWTLEKTSHG